MFTKTPFAPGTEGVWLGLPPQVYHAAPGVSQSTLKEFDEYASPAHYQARGKRVATPDMEFGTICHTAVLEPERLKDTYYVQPQTYPAMVKGNNVVNKPWHGGADYCKEWNEKHSDRPVISAEKEAAIPKIVDRVKALREFGSALKTGHREVSFFRRDEVTGLLLKCRTDLFAMELSAAEKWIFDLKKVQSGGAAKEAFGKECAEYGYHIQAASYLKITGASHFVFVPFDDAEPFDACQWEPDAEMIDAGAYEWRRILTAFAKCVKENHWPGYASGIQKLALPAYAKRKLTQAQTDEWLLRVAGGLV